MSIKLTQVERQILFNQNKILSFLDSKNKNGYEIAMDILYDGYEKEYPSVVNVYPEHEVKTLAVCQETIDILQMFRKIDIALAQLSPEEKENLDLESLEFKGFDANNDPHYYYLKFMVNKLGKWEEYKEKKLNSHTQSDLHRYRSMLSAMNERLDGSHSILDKDDLEYVIEQSKAS